LLVAFFECLNRGDIGGALALGDPDAFVEIIPLAIKGRFQNEARPFLEALLIAFPDLLIQARSLLASADVAVAEIKMEGTQAADFFGILDRQKHLDVDQAWMLWAGHGKIMGLRAYWCQNQLYRRLTVKTASRSLG
jgi:predicted ester cyclase